MDKFAQTHHQASRVAYLIAGYIRGTLTGGEQSELDAWVSASNENMLLFEELTDEENIEKTLQSYQAAQTEAALQSVKERIGFKSARGRLLALIGVAAMFILVVSIGFWFFRSDNQYKVPATAVVPGDVRPGSSSAVLKLGSGEVVILSPASGMGLIAAEGGARISYSNAGSLLYQADKTNAAAPDINELQTPKGSQFQLVLPDGTIVWLNAASFIRYPTVFSGNQRLVELHGEAYFDVAHRADMPFKVKVDSTLIEVLGTEFNVDAYKSPDVTRTTLVQGSLSMVPLTNKEAATLLRPGDQATVTGSGISVKKVTTAVAVAWKNGLFYFHDVPIDEVMRQLTLWYDVDIVYQFKPTDLFTASIPRNLPLSRVLQLLAHTRKVSFALNGKTLEVMRGK